MVLKFFKIMQNKRINFVLGNVDIYYLLHSNEIGPPTFVQFINKLNKRLKCHCRQLIFYLQSYLAVSKDG